MTHTEFRLFDILLGQDSPPLPSLWAMQVDLRLGWAVVLSWVVLWFAMQFTARPWSAARRFVLVAPVLVWTCLPGTVSPAFWLGLAFNAPSLVSVLLCAWLLVRQWLPPRGDAAPVGVTPNAIGRLKTGYQVMGIALGLLLLLDWMALLPGHLYSLGFGPLPVVLVFLVSLIPCVAYNPWQRETGWMLLPPLACIVFSLTRLPSGNLWDAMLDPLLWLVLCGHVMWQLVRTRRSRT